MAFNPSSKEDLLELWRRIFPEGYTVPIEEENNGQGLDAYSAQAAVFSESSESANTSWQALFLKPHSVQTAPEAGGAQFSEGSITLSRIAPADGPINLSQGTLLSSRAKNVRGNFVDGPVFELTSNVLIPEGSLGPIGATARAVRPGPDSDLPLGRIVGFVELGRASLTNATIAVFGTTNNIFDSGAGDQFTPDMVNQFVRIDSGVNAGAFPRKIIGVTVSTDFTYATVDGPPLTGDSGVDVSVLEYEDLGVSVLQTTETSGGRHAELDAIGRDRGAGRQGIESDDAYRDRLCELVDIISPGAIIRIASRTLTPLGIGFRFKETRDISTLPGFILGNAVGFTLNNAFDLPDNFLNGQVLLDQNCGAVRYFQICVGLGAQGEFGAPYDSPYPDNAWDLLFFDGFPVGYASALQALYEAVEAARAAGVCWDLVLDTSL